MTADEIRELRERIGLTQREFADAVGVDTATVSHWETDKHKPRGRLVIANLDKLAKRGEKNNVK